MKTLFLQCSMGASGDMLLAALLDLLPNANALLDELNGLPLPGISISSEPAQKNGISGRRVRVHIHGQEEGHPAVAEGHGHAHAHGQAHSHAHIDKNQHSHQHSHRSIKDVLSIIAGLPLAAEVRDNAAQVYRRIAAAEAEVHGRPVDQVHFHELGALDAVVDIVGVCLAMQQLAPQRVIVSPVRTGFGTTATAHGPLPVPAPATALLLQGIPCYAGALEGELCTPTGAALLAQFADEFGQQPLMNIEKIGCGLGSKDFAQANCLRVFCGSSLADENSPSPANQQIVELMCNIDDMPAEDIGFCLDLLQNNAALDAYTTPIQMKKQRPGVLLSCLCLPEDADRLAALMLKHTSSWGVRSRLLQRHAMQVQSNSISTTLGEVRIKSGHGYGSSKHKLEYADLAAIAEKENLPLAQVRQIINAYLQENTFKQEIKAEKND